MPLCEPSRSSKLFFRWRPRARWRHHNTITASSAPCGLDLMSHLLMLTQISARATASLACRFHVAQRPSGCHPPGTSWTCDNSAPGSTLVGALAGAVGVAGWSLKMSFALAAIFHSSALDLCLCFPGECLGQHDMPQTRVQRSNEIRMEGDIKSGLPTWEMCFTGESAEMCFTGESATAGRGYPG